MTAALIAGEFGGSLAIGFLIADRFGRRMTAIVAACIYLVGQAIIVGSTVQGMFIAGRVVNGLGAGALFQTMSLYVALPLAIVIADLGLPSIITNTE